MLFALCCSSFRLVEQKNHSQQCRKSSDDGAENDISGGVPGEVVILVRAS